MNLGSQRLETIVLIGKRSGHLPHLLNGSTVGAMRQHSDTYPECRKTGSDPVITRTHLHKKFACRRPFILLLDSTTVEQRPSQYPAIISSDQKALNQNLCIDISEVRITYQFVYILTRQYVGDQVTLFAQFECLVTPLPMLKTATVVFAGVRPGRQHGSIIAKPPQT